MSDEVTSPIRQAIERVLETPAQKVARAIIDIGNPATPRTMYQLLRVSEDQVIAEHQKEQARRLK